jgi:hypothetical protein
LAGQCAEPGSDKPLKFVGDRLTPLLMAAPCRLALSPDVMASFFRTSLDAIIDRAQAMLGRAGGADVVV